MKRLSTFFYAPCLQKVRSAKEGVNNVVGEKGAARLLVFDHKHFLHVFFLCLSRSSRSSALKTEFTESLAEKGW